jgi:hypothetical protein
VLQFLAITVLLVSLGLAARWLTARSRPQVTWEDRCAGCGYIVVGLPEAVCPECGADLSRPGAVRPAGVAAARLSRGAVVVLWTFAFGAAFWAVEVAWLGRTDRVDVTETTRRFGRPDSGAYDGFDVRFRGEVYRRSVINGAVDVTLRLHGGETARMTIDPVMWAYRTTGGRVTVQGPRGFDVDVLARWIGGYGIPASDPAVRRELEVVNAAVGASQSNVFRFSNEFSEGSGSSSGRARETYLVRAVRGSMLVTWLTVAVWLWQRSRGSEQFLRAMGARF